MVETKARSLRVGFLGISVLVLSLPACQSPGSRHWGWRQPADSSNVAYRPAYEWSGTRPLYVSGYAGADYGPMRPRRRGSVSLAPVPPAEPAGLTIRQGSWDGD